MQKNFQTKNYKVIPNLIWNLPHKSFISKTTLSERFRIGVRNDFMDKQQTRVEDPETSSGIACFMNGNYVGGRSRSASRTRSFRDDPIFDERLSRGFTLIELLVVVLIIGILAAVALPQYQLAVTKARTSTMWPILKSIAMADNMFYLSNGSYSYNVHNLDISLPDTCTPATGGGAGEGQIWKCDNYFLIDNSGGLAVTAFYCPGYNDNYDTCGTKRDFWIQVSWTPTSGYTYNCGVLNDSSLGKKICNSLMLN